MKKIFSIIVIGVLFLSCTHRKVEQETKVSISQESNDEESMVNDIIDAILEMGNEKAVETLKIIDSMQELHLKQNDEKCGEWGGDIVEIRIYKNLNNENIYADYKKTIIDCKDPDSYEIQPEIIKKNNIHLNENHLNLVEKSILELVQYKLSAKRWISHSGHINTVISKDSTLLIEDYSQFKWPTFKKFITLVEKE